MSRQDLKEESKESEGSPEVKARIRRLQLEASQRAAEQAQAINDVKDASVVITNPTHFAIAIKYEPTENDAPIIIAMGKDAMAFRGYRGSRIKFDIRGKISTVGSCTFLYRQYRTCDFGATLFSSGFYFGICLSIRARSKYCLARA